MRESMRNKNDWSWYASGKHPVTKDFFSLGQDQPIFRAFSEWVDKGYRMLSATKRSQACAYSWRFWIRGFKKQDLVCGLVKDSCDFFGRPHPLVLVGAGHLRKWQAHWERLPLVLGKTWQQMEHLTTKRLLDINQLEEELGKLASPMEDWFGANFDRNPWDDSNPSPGGPTTAGIPAQNPISDRLDPPLEIIALTNFSQNDQPLHLTLLHENLKKRSKQSPNAIFMGGIPAKSCLVLFKRPLRPEDFNTLWSSCAEVSSTQPND